MSDKRKVRRVLVMIDYGEGGSANGEVFDLTALVSEMHQHAPYSAHIEVKVEAHNTYLPAGQPQRETRISFNGYAGESVYGATHLDDVVNASLPDGERVKEVRRKKERVAKKLRELENDVMVARLRQAAEIRHSHPIARFHEPLPELPPPAAPALTVAPAEGGAS